MLGKYFSLSRKFAEPCVPSRDNIFLYPTNLIALAKEESSAYLPTEQAAKAYVKDAKLSPFGRFGLIKTDMSYDRKEGRWAVSVKHNAMAVRCAEVLSQSLVWSLKHRSIAIGETLTYWQEFLDYANELDELDEQCMYLLKKISVMEHADLGKIVNEAIMIRMLKPVAPPKRHW